MCMSYDVSEHAFWVVIKLFSLEDSTHGQWAMKVCFIKSSDNRLYVKELWDCMCQRFLIYTVWTMDFFQYGSTTQSNGIKRPTTSYMLISSFQPKVLNGINNCLWSFISIFSSYSNWSLLRKLHIYAKPALFPCWYEVSSMHFRDFRWLFEKTALLYSLIQ